MPTPSRHLPAAERNLLWARSGEVCAFPPCDEPLIVDDQGSWVTVAETAHIHAHSPGGARYLPELPPERRESYENTMLMCRKHHRLVDNKKNEHIYTADLLRQWKADHESQVGRQTAEPRIREIAVPPPLSHVFVERQELQKEVEQVLAVRGKAVLVGMSGTGKTQLAVRLLESAEQYTFRWWARASSRETLENDLAGIGAFLGISPGQAEPVADIAARVVQQLNKTAGWLLVIDDAADKASLTDLLPQSGGHVVITTQDSGWYGYGDTVSVPMLNTEETKTILRTVPSASASDDPALDELVALTSGLAMAVAQIASYMAATGSTVAEFAQLLREHRAALLARGDAGSHVTLGASVDITLEKLSPAAVQLLQMLSVLAAVPLRLRRDHFSDSEVHGVLANPVTFEDAIVELRSYSLIEHSSGSVSAHELIQDLVSQRMSKGEFLGALLRALHIVDQQLPERTGLASSWPIVEQLLPHILSLLQNLASAPRFPIEASTLLLNRLSTYYSARGQKDEAERLLRQALELLNTSESGDDSSTRGSLLNNLGNLQADRGDLRAAEETLREAIRQKEQGLGPENRLVGIAYAALATVVDALGRRAEAEELHSRALSIYRADGDDEHISDALSDLAQFALDRGDLDSAHELVAEAIDVASGVADAGAWPELCRAYLVHASILELEEEHGEAVSAARSAVRVASAAAPKSTQLAMALATQGRLLGAMDERKAGVALLRRAEAMYREIEGPGTLEGARMKGNLGRALSTLGEHDEAVRLLRESEELISALLPSSHPTVVTARFLLGEALLAAGEFLGGIQALLEIADRTDDLPEVRAARALLGGTASFFHTFEMMRSHGESVSGPSDLENFGGGVSGIGDHDDGD